MFLLEVYFSVLVIFVDVSYILFVIGVGIRVILWKFSFLFCILFMLIFFLWLFLIEVLKVVVNGVLLFLLIIYVFFM